MPGVGASGLRVVLTGIHHRYGPTVALSGVDFDVDPGEIHALVGENGAGKTTLARILSGLIRAESGSITINGEEMRLRGRHQSAAMGIGVVHQHLSLVERFTVAENMLLGRPGLPNWLSVKDARTALKEIGWRIGLDVDPDAIVGTLPLRTRQLIEIATALAWDAKLLVLDEPTAVLGPTESEALLELLRLLRDDLAVGVVLISHKLQDVLAVSNRVTVLRQGRVVTTRECKGATTAELARAMIGSDLVPASARAHRPPSDAPGRLSLVDVGASGIVGVNLEAKRGEIIGIAGLSGSGQTELLEAVAGLVPLDTGVVKVDGERVDGRPEATLSARVAYIPEDRHRDAVAEQLPVWANVVAKRTHDPIFRRRFVLNRNLVRTVTSRVTSLLRVRPNAPDRPLDELSGGNQQRLVVGRELDAAPKVVLASEPTRGLDPQSALEVRSHLIVAADAGAAVMISSSDLDELFALADRLVVIHGGRLVLDTPVSDTDRETIGLAMAGVDVAAR